MSESKTTTMERDEARGRTGSGRDGVDPPTYGGGRGGSSGSAPPGSSIPKSAGSSPLRQYKPEQGKYTRLGTFLGGGALVAWGAYYVYQRLQVYQGDDWTALLITTGIPLLFATLRGGLVWWVSFGSRGAGDFMIATEGEMKKVSWSTRREVVGSTKVVILFTLLLALYLFVVDIVLQKLFHAIGVLRS